MERRDVKMGLEKPVPKVMDFVIECLEWKPWVR